MYVCMYCTVQSGIGSHETPSRDRVFYTKSRCFQPVFTQQLRHKVTSKLQKSHAEISQRSYIWAVLSIMLSVGGTVISLFEYSENLGDFLTYVVRRIFEQKSRESTLGIFLLNIQEELNPTIWIYDGAIEVLLESQV